MRNEKHPQPPAFAGQPAILWPQPNRYNTQIPYLSMTDEMGDALRESAALLQTISKDTGSVQAVLDELTQAFSSNHQLLIAGNGGSAADAQHIAAELVHRFSAKRRPALRALALSTDTSILTAISNDWSYEEVFSRQVEAHSRPGDVLLLISTSGHSKNLLRAAEQAKKSELRVIGLLGNDGGALKEMCDLSIVVPHSSTARIQEAHRCIYHILCQQLEKKMFP